MLIIFDVDGTLLGGEAHDWASFDQAILTVLGFQPDDAFFDGLSEVTAQTIAAAAVRKVGRETDQGLEDQIRAAYLTQLQAVRSLQPTAFPIRPGVVALLAHLDALPGVRIAIATGDWHSSISFKLAAAGLNLSKYPLATSSDCDRRADIIKLAAQRAGGDVTHAVYVGDGVWDLRACCDLGIRFIGTGTRAHLLRKAGAEHIVEIFEEHLFMQALSAVFSSPPRPLSSGTKVKTSDFADTENG